MNYKRTNNMKHGNVVPSYTNRIEKNTLLIKTDYPEETPELMTLELSNYGEDTLNPTHIWSIPTSGTKQLDDQTYTHSYQDTK